MKENNRQYLITLGELVERLSILQLREMLIKNGREKNAADIRKIMADINTIISSNKVVVDAKFLRLVLLTGELNTLIWLYKDRLEDDYNYYLKLSHQLNGLRNQIKNIINTEAKEEGASVTNVSTDGLDFYISL